MSHNNCNQNMSYAEKLASLSAEQRHKIFKSFSQVECEQLLYDWWFWGRKNQFAPLGNWYCWLVLAGRGFGKTRMGVEWVKSCVEGSSPLVANKNSPKNIALIAQTQADAREVMIDGESGFLANCKPSFRPKFEVSRKRLVWPNGAVAHVYSADEPDQLRGPQHDLAWGDELAKWKNGDECWSNLLFGLRLGKNPRVAITTTPKPTSLLKKIMTDPDTVVTKGSTFDNRSNLSPVFIKQMERLYQGTQLGMQELEGKLVEDVEGALWSYDLIEKSRVKKTPELKRIVVAVDPPVSQTKNSDACGIVVAAKGVDDHIYILADRSNKGLSPVGWATEALKTFHEFDADRLIAEVNNGGDLVEVILRQLDSSVSYKPVRASRGKILRAEPVAALYERKLVHHVNVMKELELELTQYTGDKEQASPDRLDALVWAVTELALTPEQNPRIRRF